MPRRSPRATARLGPQFPVRIKSCRAKNLFAPQIRELVQLALSFRAMRIIGQEAAHSSPKPSSASLFNRRDLIRAALFAGAASALGPAFSIAQAVSSGLTAAAKGEDGSTFLTDPNWKAAFLTSHQNRPLIVLTDVIIPTSNTAGPKLPRVDRRP